MKSKLGSVCLYLNLSLEIGAVYNLRKNRVQRKISWAAPTCFCLSFRTSPALPNKSPASSLLPFLFSLSRKSRLANFSVFSLNPLTVTVWWVAGYRRYHRRRRDGLSAAEVSGLNRRVVVHAVAARSQFSRTCYLCPPSPSRHVATSLLQCCFAVVASSSTDFSISIFVFLSLELRIFCQGGWLEWGCLSKKRWGASASRLGGRTLFSGRRLDSVSTCEGFCSIFSGCIYME